MRLLFAASLGITLYCLCGVYWALFDSPNIQLKGLFGSIVGAIAFGSYAYMEFRRMMRGENVKFKEEREWLEHTVRSGMGVSDAKSALGDRFQLKQQSPGFSARHGSTIVYDYSSALSDVRMVTKDDFVLKLKVDVLRQERA